MSNKKSMTVRNTITTLYEKKWSKSRIARELGIHRHTVGRYIRLADAQAADAAGEHSKSPILPTGSDGSKSPIPPTGSQEAMAGRKSQCEPFQDAIKELLEKGLTAQRIYQDLISEHGYDGNYDAVKRYVRRLRQSDPERIYRIECLPGEEAQVDFGSGRYLEENGKLRKVNILRVILSNSRKGYAEAVPHQTSEAFIRCLENAFRTFCGVPQTLVIDNLRAAVKKADWYEPELCPKVESFARHYGTVFMPCRVGTPKHNGKVENGVKYIKSNALKARVFPSLQALNTFLKHWEATVADTRIHGTTRRQVRKQFEEIERPALLPLPPDLFPCFDEGRRTVHRDSHVEVAKAYYKVPEEYIGQAVWVRWNKQLVRVFNKNFEQITVLSRQQPGQFTKPLGARGRYFGSVERDKAYWLRRSARIGDHCGLWALEVIAQRGSPAIRVLQGLVNMSQQHSCQIIDKACGLALSHGAYRLRDVRRLIEQPTTQQCMDFMTNHPLIRDMQEYTDFLNKFCCQNETSKDIASLEKPLIESSEGSFHSSSHSPQISTDNHSCGSSTAY